MRTFNLVVLAIFGLFIASCDDDDRLGDWEKSIQFSGAGREGAVCFKDEATQTVFVGLGFGTRSEEFADMYQFDGKNWSQINTTFPAPENKGSDPEWTKNNGNGRHSAVAFVIGDYAYVGTGYVTAVSNSTINRDRKFFNDFYRFNIKTKQWDPTWSSEMKVNGTPVDGRRDAVAFSDGTYGYVGTGYGENDRVYKDFYRFDPNAPEGQQWTEIEFSGDARYGAVSFVINNAAYVCLGSSSVGSASAVVTNVVKFDFATKTWQPMGALADKPGIKQDKDYARIPRVYAVSFTSNAGKDGEEYAYIALGGGNPRTVWKYNHKKDQWHQMEDLATSATSPLYMSVGFSINGYGYYSTGGSNIDVSSTNYYIETWKFIPDVKETRRNDY